MESKFILVKIQAKDKGLSADVIVKVIELMQYAEDNDVEMYNLDGKLRMRYTGVPENSFTDDVIDGSKSFVDGLFDMFSKKKPDR